MFIQPLLQLLFTFNEKGNGLEARFVGVHRSNHLVITEEFTGMEFDLLKFYPVAVNLYLVVNPPQVKKVAPLVSLT